MPRGRLIGLIFLFLAFILAGLIVTDAVPYLRGPAPETSEWYWPFLLRPVARWWPAGLVAASIAGLGGWWLRRQEERQGLPLVLLVLLLFALQAALVYADRPNVGAELVDRTLSKASNGYLATAGEIHDLDDALRRFPELMPTFDNDHAQTHPPGFIAAHWLTDHGLSRMPALAQSLARPATFWRCTDLWVLARPPSTAASLLLWSWLPLALAAMSPVPAYRLARRWFQPPPARIATLLVGTLPALLVFAPTPDQAFAFLSLVSLLWLVAGLEDAKPGLVLVSGLTVSLMSFLSLGNVAWGALLGMYLLWWLLLPNVDGSSRLRDKRSWIIPVLFGVGAAAFWLIYWLGWGVAPWTIAQVGLGQHYELVTSLRRYDWWLGWNLVDFLLYAGPPIVVGLVWQAIIGLRRSGERDTGNGRLALLLVGLLLAINLAGSTRGEVGRLWLVFMPATAVVAGGYFGRRVQDWLGLWMLLIAQLVLVLSIGLSWRSFYAVILPVERPGMAVRDVSNPTDVTFATPDGREIVLAGYDLSKNVVTAGETVDVSFKWMGTGPTLRPYTVFVQVIDSSGIVVAQQDRWPVEGLWPSTCWPAGETVPDSYQVELPADVASGSYSLVVGLYDAASGLRLLAQDGSDHFKISEIVVEP